MAANSAKANKIITDAAYKAGVKAAIQKAARIYSTVVAYTLWNTNKYDKAALTEMMGQIHKSFDMINDGYTDIKDLSAVLEEEAEFTIDDV